MEDKSTYEVLLERHTEDEIRRYDDLKRDIKELKESVDSILAIWNQARGVLTFIKWIAGISSCLGAFFLFVKDHWK